MWGFDSSAGHGLLRSSSFGHLPINTSDSVAFQDLPFEAWFDDESVSLSGSPRRYDSDIEQDYDSPSLSFSLASTNSSSGSVCHTDDGYSSLDDEFLYSAADLHIGKLHQEQPTLLEDEEVDQAVSTCLAAIPTSTSAALSITSTDQAHAVGQNGNEDININCVHQTQAIHLTKGHKSVIQGDVVEYDVQFNAPMSGHLDVPAGLIKAGRTYRVEVRFEPVDPAVNVPCDEMHYVDFGFTLSDDFGRADSHSPVYQQQVASDQVNCRRPMSFDCLIQPGLSCIGIDVRMLLAVQNAGRRDNDRLPSMRMTISLYGNGNSHSLVHWSAIFHGGRRVDASASHSSSRSPKRDRDENSDDSAVSHKLTGGKSAKKPRSK